MDLKIFEMEKPPFKSVLKWKERNDHVDYLVEFAKKTKSLLEGEVEEDYDHTQNYCNFSRAINLLRHFKVDDVFKEVFEIYRDLIDCSTDYFVLACEKYLLEFSSRKFITYLYDQWQQLHQKNDYFQLDAFIFLIKAGAKDEKIVAQAKEYLVENDTFELSADIIRYLRDDSIKRTAEKRLKYIAPLVKYFQNDPFLNEYLQQWNELGEAYVETYLKVEFKNPEINTSRDETFLIDILGHTDPRISDKINKNAALLFTKKKYQKVIMRNICKIENCLSNIFMKDLPASHKTWLSSKDILNSQRKEFMELSKFLSPLS